MITGYLSHTIKNIVYRGEFMQTANISQELDIAINSIEKLLNGKNSEEILETIRRFKADKSARGYSTNQIKRTV